MATTSSVRQVLAGPVLRRVLTAYLVFNVAEWANWIALLVWGYQQGGVVASSTVAVAQLVPAALLAPVTAALMGRFRLVRALALGYAVQSIAFCATGVVLLVGAPYAVVLALAIVSAVAITMTRPVHNAMLPEVSRTTADCTAANAASGTAEGIAVCLGPLVSGLLIAPFGPGGVLVATGLLSALSVALTAALPSRPRARLVREPGEGLRQDVGVVLRHPAARVLGVMIAAEYVLVGMLDILLVSLAIGVLSMSDSGPGLLNASLGIGSLVGAVVGFALVGRQRLAPAILLAALAAGVPLAFAGISPVPLAAMVLLAMSGAGKLVFDVGQRTFVQRSLPDDLLTAVFGMAEATMMAGIALGSLAAPLLVAWLGTAGAFVAAGLFLPLVALLVLRTLRRLDRESVVPPDSYALLEGVPFLAALPPRVVERLAREMSHQVVLAGHDVVVQGERGDRFFVIESGRFAVLDDGRVVRELGAGQSFGEIALLRAVPRTMTVSCTEPGRLGVLQRRSFLVAVTGAPQAVDVADAEMERYDDPDETRPPVGTGDGA